MSPVISYRPNAFNVRYLAPPPADYRPVAKTKWEPRPETPKTPSNRAMRPTARKQDRPDHRHKDNCQHLHWCHNGPVRIKCRNCSESRRVNDRETAKRIIRGELPIPERYSAQKNDNPMKRRVICDR